MIRSSLPRTIIVIVLLCALAVGWYLLFFPEEISEERLTDSFKNHEAAMNDIANYLVKNNISADITGFFTIDDNYGVPKLDETSYRNMVTATEELLTKEYSEIISDGKTVEFIYESTGGYFNKLYGSVIYNGEDGVDGRITVSLNTKGWHLYIEQT